LVLAFFFSSRRRHTIFSRDWSSDVCSSDLVSTAGHPRGYHRRLCCPAGCSPCPRPRGSPCSPPCCSPPPAAMAAQKTTAAATTRSEERRVGKGGGTQCSTRRHEE